MSIDPLLPRLRWRVLDPVSGAVITNNLPHLHQSNIVVSGFQPSYATGGLMVGSFEIRLFPPYSDEKAFAEPDYSKLAVNQRVEAYLGDVLGGDPVFTGVIRELPSNANDFRIRGLDSVCLAQETLLQRAEAFSGTTDTLLKAGLNGQVATWADDFSGVNPLSQYTQVYGAWSVGSNEGYPTALTISDAGSLIGGTNNAIILTTSSFPSSAYSSPFAIHAYFRLAVTTPGPTDQVSVIFGATDSDHFHFARFTAVRNSDGTYSVGVDLNHTSAHMTTLDNANPPIASQVIRPKTIRLHVVLLGTQSGGNTVVRVMVNGIDSGLSYTISGTPSGKIGCAMHYGNTDFHQVWFDQLVFLTRSPFFQQGTIAAGTKTLTQVFSRASMVDLWNMAATTEGVNWRKNPKAGLYQDKIDFGAAASSDLSNSVIFSESQGDIVDIEVDENVDDYATMLEVNGSPGPDNAGTITWFNVPALKASGVVQRTRSIQGLADFLALRTYASGLAALASSPGQAKTLTIVMDPDKFMRWRERDYVTLHAPERGFYHQRVQVVAWTLDEMSPKQVLTLDQFSNFDLALKNQDLLKSVEMLRSGGDEITQSVVGGLIFDGHFGSPNLIPFTSGLQNIGANAVPAWNAAGNLRLVFHIPYSAANWQKVGLAFTTAGTAGLKVFVDSADITAAIGAAASGNQGEFDITSNATSAGWHELQLSSTAVGNGVAQAYLYALAKAI